jgi:hypothetical protein
VGQETQALTKLINHKTRRQSSASILLPSGVEKVKAKYHLQMKREKVFQGQKAQDATRKINRLKLK